MKGTVHPLASCVAGLSVGCQAAPLALAPPILAAPPGAPVVVTLGPDLTMTFVPLPGGRFLMGSPEGVGYDAEHPAHEAEVAPFAIATTEVTLDAWAVAREAGSRGPDMYSGADRRGDRPIDAITWCEAVRFANALSARLPGAEPVYAGADECRMGGKVRWDRSKKGFRLPTEAEWEYAARAGTTTPWWTGDDETSLADAAWVALRGSAGVHGVAQKRANPWGLYDMNGNVWEWTWDAWAPYGGEPAADEARRAVRGGGAWHVADLARSAFRYPRDAREIAPGQGLRLVLDAGVGGGVLR
jgi:formylglycine-generating enzyme required for sulfatase activity